MSRSIAVSMLLAWMLLAGHAGSFATPQEISLPLQGYYRPGRYLPVRVSRGAIEIAADVAIPTDVEPAADAVVPLLIVGHCSELHAGALTLPLHELGSDQVLVASMADCSRFAQPLFLHQRIELISIDPANPLPGPPAAWEALDALVLENDVMRRVNDARRSVLLAAGTVLVSVGAEPPDQDWPWMRNGSVWILRHASAGPGDAIVNEAAYTPTFSWAVGWPDRVQRTVAAAGGMFALAALATLLLPMRWRLGAVALLSVAAVVAVLLWRRSLGGVQKGGGAVLIADASEHLVQRDTWLFERQRGRGVGDGGVGDGLAAVAWTGATRPIFAAADQPTVMELHLHVDSNGELQFIYRLNPGQAVCFVKREVIPGELPPAKAAAEGQSPMLDLVHACYPIGPAASVVVEPADVPGRWPTVIIRHADSP